MGIGGKSEIVTAIEIGTSKICVIIGSADGNDNIIVLGKGERASDSSVKKGEIVDMEKVVRLFNEALSEAEDAANLDIEPFNVYIGITGSHIYAHHGVGSIPISSDQGRVTEEDIKFALDNASAIPYSANAETIDQIPGLFSLDGRRCDKPLDQVAHKLEAHCHVICGNSNQIENILALPKDAQIEKPRPIFAGLAAAKIAITDDEYRQGVLFLDLGAGTTEYLLCYNPGVQDSGVVAVGMDHIVNDLAIALELPFSPTCKQLLQAFINGEETKDGYYHVKGNLGLREIPQDTVDKIITMRLNELFQTIHERITEQGLINSIGAGIVISGGGTYLPVVKEIAHSIFKMPVRIADGALPDYFAGVETSLCSPTYSMILGLLEFGVKRSIGGSIISKMDRRVNMMLRSFYKNTMKAFRF